MDVIVTQISAPALSTRLVQRPRLVRLVRSRNHPKLIFISAPPGYGKTALANMLFNDARARGSKCAWISLGRQDNTSERFWNLVVSALETSCRSFSFDARPSGSDESAYAAIAAIVNQASAHPRMRYLLVIDNFHYLTSSTVNEQLLSLIENIPRNLTIIISSDCAATFPIAALRLDCDVVEIGANDLRFQIEESEYYLNVSCQLDLSPQDVKSIHRASRGWPAGLQMASIALSEGKTGTDVLVAIEEMRSAFFLDVVVSRMTDEMQDFMLRISHLPRISPLLAEHVSGMPQSGALLAELEHDELFTEVAHESPPWYAFSKTFRETLHQRALETMRPEEIRALHQRASEWFEANGEPTLALEFALKAHRNDRAVDIVSNNTAGVLAKSQGGSLVSHLKQMNLEANLETKKASIVAAWAYCIAGQPRQALHWIDLARSVEDSCSQLELAIMDTIEARANSLMCDFRAAVAKAEATVASIEEHGQAAAAPWLYLTARHVLGESYCHLGEYSRSMDHLSYCSDMALPAGRAVVHYLAACELSELHALLGHWPEAVQTARMALHSQRLKLAEVPWSFALVQIQLGTLLLYDGHIDEAEDMAMRARRRMIGRSNDDGLLCLLLLESEIATARGNRLRASKSLSEVIRFAQEHAIPRGKRASVIARATILLFLIGDYAPAIASMQVVIDSSDPHDPHSTAITNLACATYGLFNGLPEEALQCSKRALEAGGAHGFLASSAYAHVVRSLAFSALKDSRAAALALLEAARMLEPYGISFPIIAAGSRASVLLEKALAYCTSSSHAFQKERAAEIAFLRHCANLVPSDDEMSAPFSETSLTPREQQIFQLLQTGKSRREIADELGISYNTVRVHVSNIYKKAQTGGEQEPPAST